MKIYLASSWSNEHIDEVKPSSKRMAIMYTTSGRPITPFPPGPIPAR